MLVLAGLSLALSLAVAVIAYRMLESRANPTIQTGRLVIAAQKLALGARVGETDIRVVSWPADTPIEGAFADPAEVVGRAVIVPVVPGEPVLDAKLAPEGAGAGIGAAIPEGKRAVAVKVNEVIGVAGFVLPGTRVDVIVTGSPTSSGTADTAKVILENVQVLSAGSQLEKQDDGSPQNVTVVTLLVTPEESQKLALAANEGRIQLALRNPLDDRREDPAAVSRKALFSGSGPAPTPPTRVARARRRAPRPRPTPPPSLVVEVIQGGARESVTFDSPAESRR
jgi:pilus assembly protein CpaB